MHDLSVAASHFGWDTCATDPRSRGLAFSCTYCDASWVMTGELLELRDAAVLDTMSANAHVCPAAEALLLLGGPRVLHDRWLDVRKERRR